MYHQKISFIVLTGVLFFSTTLVAQNKVGNGLKAIKEEDLKKDLYEMADDHFAGREAGTLDELKVSVWWSDKMMMELTFNFFPCGATEFLRAAV